MNAQTPVTVTLGLVDSVLRYLSTLPHGQVDPLIQAIKTEVMPQIQNTTESN